MKKILIVEDNDLNLKLFNDLLSSQNYHILISKDGANILQIALENFPDLILMDILLEDKSGIDIIKKLKMNPNTRNIPIIAVTAFAMKNDEIRILNSGCDAYISKPFFIDEFLSRVQQYINPVESREITV